MSLRKACKIIGFSTSSYYYERGNINGEVMNKLDSIIAEHLDWGIDKCYEQIRKERLTWNRKRVLNTYRRLGLNERWTNKY